jgi:hypothetical protein
MAWLPNTRTQKTHRTNTDFNIFMIWRSEVFQNRLLSASFYLSFVITESG